MSRKLSDEPKKERRSPSSRQRLLHAFQRLAQERRFEEITLEDIARDAGLGRATLYRHFGCKDGLMVAALEPLLAALADAGTNRSDERALAPWIAHARERRWLLRSLLASPSRPAVERRLAELIGTRLLLNSGAPEAEVSMIAIGIAAAQLAMIHAWVAGERRLPISAMANTLLATREFGNAGSDAPSVMVTPKHQMSAARLYAALSQG